MTTDIRIKIDITVDEKFLSVLMKLCGNKEESATETPLYNTELQERPRELTPEDILFIPG